MKPELPPLRDHASPDEPQVDRFGLSTLCWAIQRRGHEPHVITAERADVLARELSGPGSAAAASGTAASGTEAFGAAASGTEAPAAAAQAGGSLDPQALFDYLHFHCIPAPRTIFRGVQRVPAGHELRVESGSAQVRALPVAPAVVEARPHFPSLKRRFIELLEQAVRRQLDGSKPACFLSGGTDSSTVAGFIGRVSGKPAATFSIGFDAQGYDEMEYARIAAKAFGTEHHEYYVTPEDLVAGIPKVAASFDQPFGNSSVLPAYYCALRAREAGVTRLLAGDGGDELFGGNTRYAKQKVFAAWGQMPRWASHGLLRPLFLGTPLGRMPLLSKGASYIRQAEVPQPARMNTYNLLERLGVAEVLEPRFLAQVDVQGPAQHQQQVWDKLPPGPELDRMLAYDWRYTLAESDLPKVRGATALAGVSVGFPMLDEALAEFSRSLPAHYKLKGLRLRWFFKEALREVLPPEIITKKKQGFGLPFGVWAASHRPLRELARESVEGVARRGIVRPTFAQALFETHLKAHPGFYGEMIWVLMMLEQWLRAHAPDYRV